MNGGVDVVRFESAEPNARGHRPGVFALANGLARAGLLTAEEHAWWRRSNDWCNRAYPDPSTADPLVYDREANPGAKAWFKASAVELVDRTREYLVLLDRHGVGWVERRTSTPGRIVYEDEVQVVAVPLGVGRGEVPAAFAPSHAAGDSNTSSDVALPGGSRQAVGTQ
ncbi:hypothetical protein GCM10023221_24820 [Luteimicrobium xylanilyticum]|uniref:Uncharacterized protein n=1 Tax=Luteimicrobium xylanilyticum TaxID=1133546 RepID=A0A5P9QDZ3_9MICO|nr:hypothetical protein [Luteimicrobium xylanilyticum]QFU99607.1 hypothetical protein KDY119_03142 [Luteimicrobium xylanilyticum]